MFAREYFVSTGTITSWIKKGKILPSVEYKFGSKSLYLFSPDDVEKYRKELDIKEHNDKTIKKDFFDFLEERDYSLSYKMPFMLAFIKHIDSIGDAKIEDVLDDYIAFYQDRFNRVLQVDRSTCPYNEKMLMDRKAICRNMLTNPFEKFERKRFLYYSKDLEKLNRLSNITLKMYDVEASGDGFHTKGYIFRKDEIYRIIIGSSNMTKTALTSNREWNTRVVSTEKGEIAQNILDEFNELWNSEYALKYDEFYEIYKERYKIIKKQREIAKSDEKISRNRLK